MASQITFNVRDFSDEYSTVTFNVEDIDETTWAATDLAVGTIQTALDALTIGNIASRTLSQKTLVDDSRPANAFAQRESGLRLFWQDTVNFQKGHVTVPCPDLSLVADAGTDEVDITGVAVVSALVTAIEAVAVSPYGNSIEFYRGIIVGRRS